jgi:hypothetical protein
MIHRLPPRARGGDEDGKVALGGLLPDELGQAPRAQGGVRVAGLASGGVEWVSHEKNVIDLAKAGIFADQSRF